MNTKAALIAHFTREILEAEKPIRLIGTGPFKRHNALMSRHFIKILVAAPGGRVKTSPYAFFHVASSKEKIHRIRREQFQEWRYHLAGHTVHVQDESGADTFIGLAEYEARHEES